MRHSLTLIGLLCAACHNGHSPVMPDTAAAALPAHADGYQIEVVDAGGRPLPTFNLSGATWVEGVRGQRYDLVFRNHTGARVEVVLTVDGRDVLSGDLGDYREQRGYVVDPHDSVRVEGFRTSLSQVAAFRFTDPGDSYSARRGSPQHLGVIGAAVFRERARVAVVRPAPPPRQPIWWGDREQAEEGAADAPSPSTSPGRASAEPAPRAKSAPFEAPAPTPAPRRSNIGTQYGEETWSPVVETRFERAADRPDRVLAVYYDDRAGLTARGVVPAPPPAPSYAPGPTPFPRSDTRFAPPPPR